MIDKGASEKKIGSLLDISSYSTLPIARKRWQAVVERVDNSLHSALPNAGKGWQESLCHQFIVKIRSFPVKTQKKNEENTPSPSQNRNSYYLWLVEFPSGIIQIAWEMYSCRCHLSSHPTFLW